MGDEDLILAEIVAVMDGQSFKCFQKESVDSNDYDEKLEHDSDYANKEGSDNDTQAVD